MLLKIRQRCLEFVGGSSYFLVLLLTPRLDVGIQISGRELESGFPSSAVWMSSKLGDGIWAQYHMESWTTRIAYLQYRARPL
jgi:hypothetical protein